MPCSLRAGIPYILGASAQCSPACSSCAVEWLCPCPAHSAGEPYDAIAATRGQVWKPALRLRCVDAPCRRAAFRSRQVLAGMETRPTTALRELLRRKVASRSHHMVAGIETCPTTLRGLATRGAAVYSRNILAGVEPGMCVM